MKKDGRSGISPGSLLMLLLTALVIAACAIFLMQIAGTDVHQQKNQPIQNIPEEAMYTLEPARSTAPTASLCPLPSLDAVVANDGGEEEAEQTIYSFTLAAAGTLYAPKTVRTSAQNGAGNFDFSPIFQGLGDVLSTADLALATLETTVAGEEMGYGNYNTPPQILDALRTSGVDMISLATEHALDKGYEGLELTARELISRGIDQTGLSSSNVMIPVGGIQVAVLAYTYGLSDEGRERTNNDERGAVQLIDAQRMTQDVVDARMAGANVVIVMPHWGTKNKQETTEDVRALARMLAEAGADVILGTHPNIVQETERLTVTRADGLEYETVVCYSLGSLLTDSRAMENAAGMIARLTIEYDTSSRRVSLGALTCVPIYISYQQEEGKGIYRVVDAENTPDFLTDSERQAAGAAAQYVRSVTGIGAEEGTVQNEQVR